MGASVDDARSRYRPQMDPEYWAQIGPFVIDCVDVAAPATRYSEQELLAAAAPLALWAWQSAGLELEAHQVFSRSTIERFIGSGLTGYSTAASKNTLRSRLNRMSEVLYSTQSFSRALRPLGKSDPMAPYSPAELVLLRSWAATQQTASRRHNAEVLLALAFGTGATAMELAGMHADHLSIDDAGVHVEIGGVRARRVTVLRRWERYLHPDAHEGWLFRQKRHGPHSNLISDFVSRGEGHVNLQTRRTRSSWIVHHLTIGTPPMVLLAASGVQSLESLDRFVRFAVAPDPEDMAEYLRGP